MSKDFQTELEKILDKYRLELGKHETATDGIGVFMKLNDEAQQAITQLFLDTLGTDESEYCASMIEFGYHGKSCQDECFAKINRNNFRTQLRKQIGG